MSNVLDFVREAVRGVVREITILVDKLSSGRITPNQITTASLVLHIPLVTAIYLDKLPQAAVMLIFFGLLDTMDGELARLQKSATSWGALYDATTDRAKEVMIYGGLVYWLATYQSPTAASVGALALGGSVLVSYIKSKGEADIRAAEPNITRPQLDDLLKTGLMRFEVRMSAIVLALLIDQLYPVILILGFLSWLTAVDRLMAIGKYLKKRPDSGA